MRRGFGMLVALAGVATLVACGEAKVTQCNKITEVINKVDVKVDLTSEDAFNKLADNLEKNAKDLDAVTVADPKLVDLKKKYADILRTSAKAYRDAATAAKEGKAPDMNAATKPFEDSGKVVDELNKYCQE